MTTTTAMNQPKMLMKGDTCPDAVIMEFPRAGAPNADAVVPGAVAKKEGIAGIPSPLRPTNFSAQLFAVAISV
jgi:hypothetical protein